MRWYYYVLIFGSFLAGAALAEAEERVFEGPWVTTNRKLDGVMTAVVKDLGKDQWKGRFYGVWQGVPFDYTVKFAGKPHSLKGTAVIDHADYTWTGAIAEGSGGQPATFNAKFGGSRYVGHFEMKEKKKKGSPVVTTAAKPVTVR